jgi:hypothetical protein
MNADSGKNNSFGEPQDITKTMLRVLEAADDCTGLAVSRHIGLAAPGSLRRGQTIHGHGHGREVPAQFPFLRFVWPSIVRDAFTILRHGVRRG